MMKVKLNELEQISNNNRENVEKIELKIEIWFQ